MPAALAGQLDRVRTTLATMTFQQKALAGVLVLGLALGSFFFVRWVTTPTYEPLFSNLSSTDAAAITEELTAEGVAYELQGADTILVPKEQVYSLRLAIAGKGLTPSAGSDSGYALLDEQGITTSEFEQQTTYQRALEGELNNTLEAINGVKTASVHIAMPKDEVFVTDTSDPTAAVLLELTPGTELSGEQVTSVVNLVSSSITGMQPSGVTVTDQDGTQLSAGTGGASTDSQADDTATFQATLQSNAQRLLDQVLGAGNAIVTVAATMNFDQSQSTATTYTYPTDDPGAVGVQPDRDLHRVRRRRGRRPGHRRHHRCDHRRRGRVLRPGEHHHQQPGGHQRHQHHRGPRPGRAADRGRGRQLRRRQRRPQRDDPGPGQPGRLPRPGPRRPDHRGLDGLQHRAAEAAQADLAAADAAAASEQMWSLVKTGVVVGGLLLLVVLVWLRNRKKGDLDETTRSTTPTWPTSTPCRSPAPGTPASTCATSGTIEALERQRLRGEITSMIETQPDQVASTLRGWLAESRT